ncbi:AAA family ATPase [Candidatus Parcubacteria bacterium]|nr:AAA family ATPase [Candidatus Parcubacteria bacterium]
MDNTDFTFNWPLVGNRHITGYLEKCVSNRRISGTYIFSGPDNLGKTTLAKSFAKTLLCKGDGGNKKKLPCGQCSSCRRFKDFNQDNSGQTEISEAHGDFHIIKKDKDKKNISIEQVREFIYSLSLSSFMGGYKIGIVKHADSLSSSAANALLKTLEEPKSKVVIILIVENLDNLPATIVSRGQILRFNPLSIETLYDYLVKTRKIGRERAKELSRVCLGRPALAVKFLENSETYDFYKQQIDVFINFKEQNINERFLGINTLFAPKLSNQESAKLAKRILQAWQGVLRDYLLLEYSFNSLVQNYIRADKLKPLKARVSVFDILRVVKAIKLAEKNIAANVNPKLALEEVALAF